MARYDPSLFNLIRCLRTIRKGIGNSGGNFFRMIAFFRIQITVNTSTVEKILILNFIQSSCIEISGWLPLQITRTL